MTISFLFVAESVPQPLNTEVAKTAARASSSSFLFFMKIILPLFYIGVLEIIIHLCTNEGL